MPELVLGRLGGESEGFAWVELRVLDEETLRVVLVLREAGALLFGGFATGEP